ncbi:MFS transporter [Nocardioides hwasunensis]|uniref:MFS transporter n=1 Tax=Nocardioides hwasunensis TaxID=397258 RepID=A0ABR8MG26_9ACTN|nr:MFS transporter [Nocardioides hwasunensis]MBD3914838.1 MFS transporter [Nocardioides hwasunensis]
MSASAWEVPDYRRFLLARTVAMAGGTLAQVAMPILVFQLTGSAAWTALTAVVETLPYLVVGLPAGALADRWDRRRTLVVGEVLSAGALLTVPLATWVGVLSVGQVLAVAAVVSTAFVFTDAATFGLVPALVERERIPSATSVLVTVGTTLGLVGPVVSGVLVVVLGPAVVLGVDGVAYAVSAAVLAGLAVPATDAPPPVRRRLRVEIGEGLAFIRDHALVRRLTLLGIGNSLAGGAVTGLLVVVGVQQLGLGADDARIGWLFAAGAAGSLLASTMLPRLQRRVAVGAITTGGFAVALVGVLALSASGRLVPALVAVAAFHLASTTLIVNGIVTRQVVTPAVLQSRVNTTARLVAWGGSPLGAALGGVLAETVGTDWALRVAAFGLAASLAAALATKLRSTPLLGDLEEATTAAG